GNRPSKGCSELRLLYRGFLGRNQHHRRVHARPVGRGPTTIMHHLLGWNHRTSDSMYAHHVRHRSEEHTSELQSRGHLVCRLLLEKKKNIWRRSSSAYDV